MTRLHFISTVSLLTVTFIGCGETAPGPDGAQPNDDGAAAEVAPAPQPVYPDVKISISGEGEGSGFMWDGEPGEYEFFAGEFSSKSKDNKELIVAAAFKGASEVGDVYEITCMHDGDEAMKTTVLFAGDETDLIPHTGWKVTLASVDRP